MPWSTPDTAQVLGGRQCMFTFTEITPYRAPLETLSTSLWALHYHQGCGWQCFWAQHSPLSWLAPSVQCGPPPAIFSTIIGHLRDRKTIDTNRNQPWLHGTCIHWSDSGHTGQGHSPTENPTLSGCQGKATFAPRKVAHPSPNSTKNSSPDGGTQRNGDHFFLRGEDRSRWILVTTHLFQLDPLDNFYFNTFLCKDDIY